jgi:hypothetical protein
MKKFNKLFILFIILGALLLCNYLGTYTREGMDVSIETPTNQPHKEHIAKHNTSLHSSSNDTSNGTSNGIGNGTSNGTGNVFGKNVVYGSLLLTGNNEETLEKEVPEGDDNLYMLKSQMVPPVCPVCPSINASPKTDKCPPCPPCARCPEASFECQKVPNYSSNNNDRLPRPILADFSQFGM